MMLTHAVCFLIIIPQMYFANSLGNLTDINNKNVFHESGNNTCDNDRCLMKCCEFGKYINKIVFEGKKDHQKKRITRCQPFNKIKPTLDESFNNVFIRKPNFSSFDTKSGLFPTNASFRSNSIDITEFGFNFYLNEHAEIHVEIPNVCNRWIRVPNNMYCIDLIMVPKGTHNQRLKPGIFTMYLEVPAEKNRPTTNIMIVGMLISCFFLLLVLIVYGILPELRNLCGQILMAYVASLFGAFLTLSLMKTRSHKPLMCESLTYVIYFFFLASFFWMNVMSFDIWWTFRGYAKARQINRRGEPFKFLMYCLYAFGLPLAMTVGLAILNKVDMTSIPWFITPKIPDAGCFMQEAEKFLYLYIPMLILILSNWIMYIMTAVNIWRLSRGTAVLNSETSGSSQARRLNRKRFIIYVKLSVVMGLNWLLELMNYTKANSAVWFISDCYNVLIGLAIFIIFVCKRKILKKLLNRFSRDKKATWSPTQEEGSKSATSTCTEFSAAQEAQPLQCYNACETKI